ncbi:MAG TPA: hypothetical protein VK921_16505 [Anditalea sp.]|nr:hypothetical protein [Anditalea sp.]
MIILKHILPLLLIIFLISGCETDDDPIPEQFEATFPIDEVEDSGISGDITFFKTDNNTTLITIKLNGTVAGDIHPVRIHSTSPDQDGPVVKRLNSINGATGLSETLVTDLEDGTVTTYEDWVSFNGYVLVLQSEENINVQVALGLLGDNIPNIPGG